MGLKEEHVEDGLCSRFVADGGADVVDLEEGGEASEVAGVQE